MKNSNANTVIKNSPQDNQLDPYAFNRTARSLMNPGTGFVSPPVSDRARNKNNPEISLLTPKEMLEEWKNGGFPISTIAEMMHVERKTIYTWLDGATFMRNKYHERRMANLYAILKEGKSASYRNLYRYWHFEINNETLASLVEENNLDPSKISEHIKHLWPMAQRSESKTKMTETGKEFTDREAYISTEK